MKSFTLFKIETLKALFLVMSLGLPLKAYAGAVITYHGRILDSFDKPLEAEKVVFKIRVYSPNPGKCLLYEESREISMVNSNGVFAIPIGDGFGDRTPGVDPGLAIEEIFSNNPAVTLSRVSYPLFTCNSGGHEYTPQALDQRQLQMSFDDHSGAGEQLLPLADIGFVPFAVAAYDAQKVGGVSASSVLKVSGGAAAPLTPANFAELIKIVNGTSSLYSKAGQLSGANLPALSNGQVLGWSGGAWSALSPLTSESDPSVMSFAKANLPACGANQFLKNDGSGNLICVTESSGGGSGTVTSVSTGTGLVNTSSPGNPITATGTLAVDVGTSANQIVQLGTDGKLPAVDGSKLTNVVASGVSGNITTTGSISTTGTVSATTVTNTNSYSDSMYIRSPAAGGNQIRITGPTTPVASSYVLRLPEALPAAGTTKILVSDDAGNLSWADQSSGGVTAVTADAPLVIDSSVATAPKVTLPEADGAKSGYLSASDWTIFNSKQAAGNYITTLTGDVSSSNFSGGSVEVSVNKIKNVDIVPGSYSAGQVLKYDGTKWVNSILSSASLSNDSDLLKASNMPSGCGANQTFQFSSPTGLWTCVSIGSLSASSITSGVIDNDRLPASATYWSNATGGINFSAGNVGIGSATPTAKLDVAGEIKLGNTSSTCNAANEGQQRYDSTSKSMQFCNGTNWLSMSTGISESIDWF